MALPKEVVEDICGFADNVVELKAQCRDRCGMLQEDTLDFEKMTRRIENMGEDNAYLREGNHVLGRENKMLKQYYHEYKWEAEKSKKQHSELWDKIQQLRDYNTRLVMEKSDLDVENGSLKRKINEMGK